MSDNNTVLLTGASGFLGHHVAHVLVEAGFTVRALCRDLNSEAVERLPGEVERVVGDILDRDSVQRAAEGCTIALHCAGKVSRDPNDALVMQQINAQGTEIVLDACEAAGIRRVVMASTAGTIAISDKSDHIATEQDDPPLKLIHRWPYYRSKYYAEVAALKRNQANFEVVCINPTLLLGPGDLYGSSTEDVRRFLEQPLPVVPSGGVSFVDVRDAAQAMVSAIESAKAGSRYLLISCNCTVRTFLSRVARVSGIQEPWMSMPKSKMFRQASTWFAKRAQDWLGADDALPDPVSVDMSNYFWYGDASLAEQELRWRPRDPMETLADTVSDLRERGIVVGRGGYSPRRSYV